MKRFTAAYVATNLLDTYLDDSFEQIKNDPIEFFEADSGVCSSDEENDILEIQDSQSDVSESEPKQIPKSFFYLLFLILNTEC